MPKSESGGLGGASGSGSSSGVSSYFGKVFAVGRYQVTVEELIAEGMCRLQQLIMSVLSCHTHTNHLHIFFFFSGTHPPCSYFDRVTHSSE